MTLMAKSSAFGISWKKAFITNSLVFILQARGKFKQMFENPNVVNFEVIIHLNISKGEGGGSCF